MQITLIVIAVLLAVLTFSVAALAAVLMISVWQSRTMKPIGEQLIEAFESLEEQVSESEKRYVDFFTKTSEMVIRSCESIGRFEKANAEVMERMPKFQDGQVKLLRELVKGVVSLEQSVTAYTRLSLGVDPSSNGRRPQTFEELAEQDEVSRVAQETGVSSPEAREQLRRDRAYDFSIE